MSGEVKTRVIIDADAGNAIKEINSLDTAAGDADTALKALDDTKITIDVDADKLDTLKNKTEDVTGTSRSASAAIGGIGGSVSELPGVGALGPLAESLGQLTEGALEGEATIGELGKAIGVLGGTAVVMMGIQKVMQSIADTDAFNEEQAEAFGDAIKEVGEGAQAVLETIKEAQSVSGRAGGFFGAFEQTKDITKQLIAAGVSADEFTLAVSSGGLALVAVKAKLSAYRDDLKSLADSQRAQSVEWNNTIDLYNAAGDAIEIVTETHKNYNTQLEDNTNWQTFMATATDKAAISAAGLAVANEVAADAIEETGDQTRRTADHVKTSTDAIGAAFDRVLGHLNLDRELLQWNSGVDAMVEKLRKGMDLSDEEILDFKIDTIQTLKDLNASPETLVIFEALLDDADTKEEFNALKFWLNVEANKGVEIPVTPVLQRMRNPNGTLAPVIPDWPPGKAVPGMATNNITVNLPRAAAARDVTSALTRWARVNGS